MSAFDTARKVLAGLARLTTFPSAASGGDVTSAMVDKYGRLIGAAEAPMDNWVNGHSGKVENTTATQVIAAPGAGIKIYVRTIMVTNSDASVGTLVTIQDDSGSPVKLWEGYAASGGGGFVVTLDPPVPATANQDVDVVCGTTSAEVYCSISGFKAP